MKILIELNVSYYDLNSSPTPTLFSNVGDNGRVQYRITGGDIDQHFAVDVETGVISVAKQLDRETQAHYNLAVEALDLSADPRDRLSSTAVVTALHLSVHLELTIT